MGTKIRMIGSSSFDWETEDTLATETTADGIKALLGLTRKVSVPSAASQTGLSVASTGVTYLTVPDGATHAEIYVRSASIVFKRNGTAPTATAGFQADATDMIMLEGGELAQFGAIAVSATATIDVEYFRYAGG